MTPSRARIHSVVDLRWLLAAGLALVLAACGPARPDARPAADRTAGPIPVVRPFALERAGASATFDVELPDVREGGHLRSVFIGVRAVHDPRQADRQDMGRRVLRYLDQAAIPVRLTVHREVAGAWQPVTLMTMRLDGAGDDARYAPHPDPVFRHHRPAHWDGKALIDAGLWNVDLAYFEHEFAALGAYEPGRYRISITTLEAHPALEGLPYELVVAHRRRY
ncbi:hypothetical protein [Lysobacter humi (ex Lee et al. 2017)]